MDSAQILGMLIGMALVGLIPGFIAKAKGRSFLGFFLLGMCFFWPGLIAALVVKDKKKELMRYEADTRAKELSGEIKNCPSCGEKNSSSARTCMSCGERL